MLGLLVAAGVSGCTGGSKDNPEPTPRTSARLPESGGGIVWATWPEYIDIASHGTRRPTLDAFVRRSGIDVKYQEVINDNQAFVDSISNALKAKRPVGYDIVTLTSWIAAQIVEAGWVQPFGPVKNVANLVPALAAPDWDPEQRFSMPWQAGLTGIAYDARRVDRAIGSMTELFTRDDLKGKIGLLTEFSDTMGLTILARSGDLSGVSVDDVDNTLDFLTRRAADGQFARFYDNGYIDALDQGEVVACMAWSGDVLQAQLDNPYLKFVIPEEGLMIWADNMLVPAGSTKAEDVASLADYFYRPDVAAKVAAWVNYICPVEGAQAEMERIDPGLALSPLIFPDTTILDRSYQFPTLPPADDTRLRAAFVELADSI